MLLICTDYFIDLRVEWLRCRARAARWKEEIQLLEEEMRRSIEFCRWSASWWEGQASLRARTTLPHVAEGIATYAFEQAHDERQREQKWAAKWTLIRQRAALILDKFLSDHGDEDDGHEDKGDGHKEKGDGHATLHITVDDYDDSDAEDIDD